MKTVLETYVNALPAKRKTTSNGWIAFDCPACNDKRSRGSFLITPTGGWRYHCFNGGCDYEAPTGYETGGGLGGRPLKLLELLGGNPADLPWKEILTQSTDGEKPTKPTIEVAADFPEVALPDNSILLSEVTTPKGKAVLEYLNNRGSFYLESHPFCWSPKYPDYLIIPWLLEDKIVGWIGRNIYAVAGDRFIFPKEKASDYLFNQHLLFSAGVNMFLVEGELDAIALNCVASRGSTLSQKQINLLNLSGKNIIVVPDRDAPSRLLGIAETQGWKVSCPEWGNPVKGKGIKDVSEAMKQYGQLIVIDSLVKGITSNYINARVFYNLNRTK